MKKLLSILFCFFIILFIGCGSLEATKVAKIKVKDIPSGEIVCYDVDSRGKAEKIDSLTPDDAIFLFAGPECFCSYIENNKVKNKLLCIDLYDSTGKYFDAYSDDNLIKIMNLLTDINHDIMSAEIIIDGNSYLAYVTLNVNWQDPCVLYAYDENAGTLTKLFTLQNMDLLELQILN